MYWYGPENTFRHYPVYQIFNSALALDQGETPAVALSEFNDRIVLIGPTAISLADFRPSPFSPNLPGVEYHATLISNLLQGHFVRPAGDAWAMLAIVLLSLGTSLAVWRFTDWRAYTAAAVGLALGFLALNFLLFHATRMALVLVAPLAAAAITYGTGNLTRYVTEGREKKRYRSTLMKYVSPQIVEAMTADRRLAELHNEKRDLTVLFSDVRGFTTMSEKIPVDQLVATLNEFLNAMVEVIFRNQGTLDKFVGDCVMAFWGAPLRLENHAELAARTALQMQADLPPVIGPPSMLVHTPLQPGGAERNPAVTAGSLPGLAAGSPTRCAGELCYTPAAIPQSTPSLPARCKRSLHSETRLETSR